MTQSLLLHALQRNVPELKLTLVNRQIEFCGNRKLDENLQIGDVVQFFGSVMGNGSTWEYLLTFKFEGEARLTFYDIMKILVGRQ